RAAGTLARKVPPAIVRAGGHFGNAATVGAMAYEVYREESLAHKGERAGSGVAAAGVNIALGGAAASAAETAALTGVAGATGATVIAAAAPVIVAANGSYMPRWLRGGDSVDKYNDANGELQNLLGAKAELAMFRQDLRRYKDQHPAGEIVKAADHQTTAPGSKEKIASGFNAAGNAAERPEPHPPSGDVAGTRQRT